MVTAELAAALPVLMLVLAVVLTAVAVVQARVRAQDAAREAARAAARGDSATARRLAAHAAPTGRLTLTESGTELTAVVDIRIRPLGGWLPGFTISERAVAAVEAKAASP